MTTMKHRFSGTKIFSTMLAVGMGVLALGGVAVGTGVIGPVSPAGADSSATPVEQTMAGEIVAQINHERAARGLGALSVDTTLTGLAQGYANAQSVGAAPPGDATYPWSSHSSYQWFGFGAAAAGTTTPSSTFTLLWMTSGPHRDTLMQNVPGQGIGIGLACGANGTAWAQVTVGSLTARDPSYTSGTPANPVVTPEGSGSSCGSPQALDSASGMASAPSGSGYWVTDTRGNVSAHGGVAPFGGVGYLTLNAPISHIVSTPDAQGYWLVAADGGTFSLGDAGFYGSMGGSHLNQPVVDMAPTPSGKGYWLVASDGGIFSFGDAQFYGSMGGSHLNQPVVGIAATPSGHGYWLVASDGGIFAFGDAGFRGSTGGTHLNSPIVGMSATASGGGYWFVASDGGVFSFGDAGFSGSATGKTSAPIEALAADSATGGYWVVASNGMVFNFNAPAFP